MKNRKVFRGARFKNQQFVTLNDEPFDPVDSNGLGLPSLFDWGNDSPEARKLAYSLLANVLDRDIANRFYIEFTIDVIQYMPDKWTLPESAVRSEAKRIAEVLNVI